MYFGCLVVSFVMICSCFFFFKQKTAYEMRISDWSSDVCSSDLGDPAVADLRPPRLHRRRGRALPEGDAGRPGAGAVNRDPGTACHPERSEGSARDFATTCRCAAAAGPARIEGTRHDPPQPPRRIHHRLRSEEHTSELQSLMRNSYT